MDTPATTSLNDLLRMELSAAEAYAQALKKISDEPGAAQIRAMASEHSLAAIRLRELVVELGGEPSTDSNAWNHWSKTVLSTINLFENAAACRALRDGEELCFKAFRMALFDDQLPDDARAYVHSILIPWARSHIAILDHLLMIASTHDEAS